MFPFHYYTINSLFKNILPNFQTLRVFLIIFLFKNYFECISLGVKDHTLCGNSLEFTCERKKHAASRVVSPMFRIYVKSVTCITQVFCILLDFFVACSMSYRKTYVKMTSYVCSFVYLSI